MEKLSQTTSLKFGTGPDLRSIWVPPPQNPPDLIKDSSSSTSGSLLDERLSSSRTSLSKLNAAGDKRRPASLDRDYDSSDEDESEGSEDGRCNSFTTDANDDFEFCPVMTNKQGSGQNYMLLECCAFASGYDLGRGTYFHI
jgi:hypothetical protein